jgi:Rod binding domain-containing protein
MDGSDLILTAPIMPSSPMDETAGLLSKAAAQQNVSANGLADSQKTEKLAKDFESVLLTKLFDTMKETVNQFNDEEDSAGGQVQGLFWLCLARDVADKGGLGLWKDLQRFFTDLQNPAEPPAQSLDEGL